MASDGTSYYGNGYYMAGAYGEANVNYVPNQPGSYYVMQYGYNSKCILIGVRFHLPFFYGGYSAHTISSQNNSTFYFALIPSTNNPSAYQDVKTFNVTWSDYNSNSGTSYTSNSTNPSQSGNWFMGKLRNALEQDIYTISYLTPTDHTMQIRSGTDTNAYYILILYRIDYQLTFTGSARPSHLFLRVNTNVGTAVGITSKTGSNKTYNIPTSYRNLTVYYNGSLAFTVNSLNSLFKKRIDAY